MSFIRFFGRSSSEKSITASILAKVAREENVLQIEEKVKESIGSGYPSNKVCQDFLKRNYDNYPRIIRKSWASYKNIIKERNQKNLGEKEDEHITNRKLSRMQIIID